MDEEGSPGQHDQLWSPNIMEKGARVAECISDSLENIFRRFGISVKLWGLRLSLARIQALDKLRDSAVNQKEESLDRTKLSAHQDKPIQKTITMCGEEERFLWEISVAEELGRFKGQG